MQRRAHSMRATATAQLHLTTSTRCHINFIIRQLTKYELLKLSFVCDAKKLTNRNASSKAKAHTGTHKHTHTYTLTYVWVCKRKYAHAKASKCIEDIYVCMLVCVCVCVALRLWGRKYPSANCLLREINARVRQVCHAADIARFTLLHATAGNC